MAQRICEGLQPDNMPASLQIQFSVLPPVEPGESYGSWYNRLTPDQQAIYDAFNKEAADGKLWLGICRTRRST